MLLVHGQLGLRQQRLPATAVIARLFIAGERPSLDRHAVRVVAFEVRGIDFDTLDHARVPQKLQ